MIILHHTDILESCLLSMLAKGMQDVLLLIAGIEPNPGPGPIHFQMEKGKG